MSEKASDFRTLVGIPFYDGEPEEVLDACLKNVDSCLNNLGIDAKIVVGVNGPRVSQGKQPLSYVIDRSKYNAEVKFIKTLPGLVNSSRTIARQAEDEGFRRIFLTDADISRLPLALKNLWELGDKPINGCNYCTYPLEILTSSGLKLSEGDLALIKVFEADSTLLLESLLLDTGPLRGSKVAYY